MNEVVSRVLRVTGWLLTPVVAGAAAFLGAWFGAVLQPRLAPNSTGFVPMILGAAVLSIGATLGWALVMRRPRSAPAPPVDPDSPS